MVSHLCLQTVEVVWEMVAVPIRLKESELVSVVPLDSGLDSQLIAELPQHGVIDWFYHLMKHAAPFLRLLVSEVGLDSFLRGVDYLNSVHQVGVDEFEAEKVDMQTTKSLY